MEFKNDDTKAVVEQEAIRLLIEQGYKDTTYADLIKSTGRSKPVVKYYVPSKEAIARLIYVKIVQGITEYLYKNHSEYSVLEMIVCGTELGFIYMLRDENTRRISLDLLSSRPFSQDVLMEAVEGIDKRMNISLEKRQRSRDAYSFGVGGAYELMHRSLRDKSPLDAHGLARDAMSTFLMFGFAYSDDESRKFFELVSLPEEEKESALDYLDDFLLS